MASFTFKYSNDLIIRNPGNIVMSFTDFIIMNTKFSSAIIKGQYFEYGITDTGLDRFDILNSDGHHFPQNLAETKIKILYKPLIDLIKTLPPLTQDA